MCLLDKVRGYGFMPRVRFDFHTGAVVSGMVEYDPAGRWQQRQQRQQQQQRQRWQQAEREFTDVFNKRRQRLLTHVFFYRLLEVKLLMYVS